MKLKINQQNFDGSLQFNKFKGSFIIYVPRGGGKFEKFLKTDAKAPKMGFYWACQQFLTSSSEIREQKKNSAPPKSQRDFFCPPPKSR